MRETLCCCEYIDKDGERNHILACCCNCAELDLCFDRFITCRRIPKRTFSKIMSTITDRFRIPWKNGAVQISFDTVLPVILLPFSIIAAAQGVWTSVITFTFLPIFLMYSHFFYMKCRWRTNFFFVWAVTSVLFVFVIFETIGMKLLEIRTDENAIFIILTAFVLLCLYKVKEKVSDSIASAENAYDGKMSATCSLCNMKVPERTFHCYICETCILMRDQHCAWLNCCIGKSNHRWYVMLLVTSIFQMLLSSNLILTSACHPFKVWTTGIEIMLPDDCSDVYYDVFFTLGFVTAIYCLEATVFLLALLLHETFLISLGMTGHEWRNNTSQHRCIGLNCSSPYSKGFFKNWFYYFRGVDLPIIPHTI